MFLVNLDNSFEWLINVKYNGQNILWLDVMVENQQLLIHDFYQVKLNQHLIKVNHSDNVDTIKC